MLQRATANYVRFILGVVLAFGSGVWAYTANGGVLLTLLLPSAILLIALADIIGYLTYRAGAPNPNKPDSEE